MFFRLSAAALFRNYLYFFQLLGLCPVVLNHSKKLNVTTLNIISLFHIILLTSVVSFVYAYSQYIFYNLDSFGRFNDAILYIVAIVAYYAIIIESHVKRETQSKIWTLLARGHQTDRLDLMDQCKLWNLREFNIYFFGYFALLICVECYRMPFTLYKSQTLNYWSLYIIMKIVSRSRHMQYIFYLNILNRQIDLLSQELKRIEEYSNYDRAKLSSPSQYSFNRFLCRRLYRARDNYSLIYEISNKINDAFGWSHLVNLTHAFVQILADTYWLYWNIDNRADILVGDSSLVIVSSVVIVFLVFGYTTEIHAKAKKISFFLHTIKQVECGGKMRDLIESFSLQLLHEPITFHAQGCFNLDLSVLRDATAAITTYMVFFIQFTHRFKTQK